MDNIKIIYGTKFTKEMLEDLNKCYGISEDNLFRILSRVDTYKPSTSTSIIDNKPPKSLLKQK